MDDLLKKLDREFESYVPEKFDENKKKELDFLTAFLKRINFMAPATIADIPKKELIIAILCTGPDHEDIDTLKEKVSSFDNIENCKDYHGISQTALKLYEDENRLSFVYPTTLKELKKTLEKIKKEEKRSFKNSINVMNIEKETMNLASYFASTEEGLLNFFYLLDKYQTIFFCSIFLSCLLISVQNDIAEEKKKTLKTKEFQAFLKEKLTNGKVYTNLKRIIERKEELNSEKENIDRKEQKRRKSYHTARELLKKELGVKKITLSKKLLDELSPTIKNDIIVYSLKKNRANYQLIEQRLEAEEKLSHIEHILKEYGLSLELFDETTRDKMLAISPEDISPILSIIYNGNLNFLLRNINLLGLVLTNTSISNITAINKIYNQGYISQKFITKNPSIFISESNGGTFENLTKNLNTLRNYKIDIKSISSNNETILLMSNEELESNFKLLEPYGLKFEKGKRMYFLSDRKLTSFLDAYIELGLLPIIKERPDRISPDSKKIISKISLCKLLGINYIDNDKNDFQKFITSRNFEIAGMTIEDSKIDDYLPNYVILQEDEKAISILESTDNYSFDQASLDDPLIEFKTDDVTYNINGVLVSRMRFLRNYNKLQTSNLEKSSIMFNCLLHGSFYDENDINTLRNFVFQDVPKRKEKRT